MKRINHFNTARDKLLHIETEGAIVNIRVGLSDAKGQPVTSIEILPDSFDGWIIDGHKNNRAIKTKIISVDYTRDYSLTRPKY